MPVLNYRDVLQRIVDSDVSTKDGILALIDRTSGDFIAPEGLLIDYKQWLTVNDAQAVAELARDILGFSNTDGGLIIIGVADNRAIIGHDPVDLPKLRDSLGPYAGTRVDFDLEELQISTMGQVRRLLTVTVRRSHNAYPNFLRKDIELKPGLVRKQKYLSGTLFYRDNAETKAVNPYEDLDSRARELRFSGAAPRTRTSFLLQTDKPLLRLYAPINDRFVGRESELSELLSKFDDPRGRGVSIAGFGGVGKTELGIKLVSELHRRNKFKVIYSGSAKESLLGQGGVQRTDPVFTDLRSFLEDLAGWLSINPAPDVTTAELKRACLTEVAQKGKALLFVDNLETVKDRALLRLIDAELPTNCWIVATGRVHRVRNFLYPRELDPMIPEDAARLLRHELKRQSLDGLADTDIKILREKAQKLFCHPLAIRWFGWMCKRNSSNWFVEIGQLDLSQLENFCVASTLGSLTNETQKVLGAVLAISDLAEPTDECIQATSGVPDSMVESCLWELECAGLLNSQTDEAGITTYSVAPLSVAPAADLARKNEWESDYVYNLKEFTRHQGPVSAQSPAIRALMRVETRFVQSYDDPEKRILIDRINRVLPTCPKRFVVRLKWLKAECERHLEHLVSADDLYQECAIAVLNDSDLDITPKDKSRILLEAATVARARVQTEPQLRRAISYLEAIQDHDFAVSRVLGMLTEMYAAIGEQLKYEITLAKALDHRKEISDSHLVASLDEALARARASVTKRKAQTQGA